MKPEHLITITRIIRHCPEHYKFSAKLPPVPADATDGEWNPQFVMFELHYKGTELLRGKIALSQLAEAHIEVGRTIQNHQQRMRYNRSLHGIWNNYPVDWCWWLLHRLGFKYAAGGRSQTHLVHFFCRRVGKFGVLVRWKGKVNGAALPWLFVAPMPAMMKGIEDGRYE